MIQKDGAGQMLVNSTVARIMMWWELANHRQSKQQ
jgi:hypothetical protein